MPVFLKICKLLINSSMRFVKNEFLTPQLAGLVPVKLDSLKVSPFQKGETFLESRDTYTQTPYNQNPHYQDWIQIIKKLINISQNKFAF